MDPDEKRNIKLLLIVGLPTLCWLFVANKTETITTPKLKSLYYLLKQTYEKPMLLLALIFGLALGVLLAWMIDHSKGEEFQGASFSKFLRGTKIITGSKLKSITTEKNQEQVTISGIPMPTQVENLHLLISGSTGTGKSVAIQELVYKGLLRGDRMIIADPDGDMLSKFWKKEDVILNPYDVRTEGWSFFNEIRNDYDFKRFALSIVPRSLSEETEEWARYARLLLRETARKLMLIGKPSMRELFRMTTIVPPEELKKFLANTDAESLFVGADKALASARFVLSDKLPEHVNMPEGRFSLREWLDKSDRGNLYITWREDMAETLKPLISAWVDVLCTSILSLSDDKDRRLWMILDELASLDKLTSLEGALTKGRKKGIRIVAGLQSTAQLDNIYGVKEAQTLRSCFRSLVVLGGAKTDPQTCEDMSVSLGEHEVERNAYSKNSSSSSGSREGGSRGTTISLERPRERVVMASEIASLPNLEGYVAFAGNIPIARVILNILNFKKKVAGFKGREALNA